MLKFHNDHMRRQRNPPNRKSRELQEVAQSMNPGAGETLNLTSPQRWALPFSGGEHFICFTLMFPPTLMWPHSNPHICPCSCGLILSLPNPPWKVLNDKLAISANNVKFKKKPYCFPSNKQNHRRQNMDYMQPSLVRCSQLFLREGAPFVPLTTANSGWLR